MSQPARSSAHIGPSAPTSTVASAALACDHHIEAHRPATDQQVVLGVVALSTSPKAPALQVARDPHEPASTRYFAKDGLLVHAGSTFELVVPDGTADEATIGWGGESLRPTRRLTVSCPQQESGQGWLVFVGGYWLPRPACIALIVRAAGKQQRIKVGVGVACPGQRPPSPPS